MTNKHRVGASGRAQLNLRSFGNQLGQLIQSLHNQNSVHEDTRTWAHTKQIAIFRRLLGKSSSSTTHIKRVRDFVLAICPTDHCIGQAQANTMHNVQCAPS